MEIIQASGLSWDSVEHLMTQFWMCRLSLLLFTASSVEVQPRWRYSFHADTVEICCSSSEDTVQPMRIHLGSLRWWTTKENTVSTQEQQNLNRTCIGTISSVYPCVQWRWGYSWMVGVSETVNNQRGYCIHTGTTKPQLYLYWNCILTQLYPLIQPRWGYSWVAGVSEAVTNLGHEAATGALAPHVFHNLHSEYQNTRTLTRNTQTQL